MNRIRSVVSALVVVAIVVLGVSLQRQGGEAASATGVADHQPDDHQRVGARPLVPSPPQVADPARSPNRSAFVPADPDGYARYVAAIVFGQDSRVLAPEIYQDALLGLADPQLTEAQRADLGRMVAQRTPPASQWIHMRANQQWSSWEGRLVWEPASRVEAVAGGVAEPGWVLRNVSGDQTTHTGASGLEVKATRSRTLTVGMRCPAPGTRIDRCRLALLAATVAP